MARSDWKLDQLKSALQQRSEIKGWIVTQEHVHRRERYFLRDEKSVAIDQDREVRSQGIYLQLFIRLAAKLGRQGEITKKLFTSLPLAPQIDSAIEAALQTDHQSWELPTSIPSQIPSLRTSDPRMAEDLEKVTSETTSRLVSTLLAEKRAAFNSAELFLSMHHRELHLSNGLIHRSAQSRIYAEAAFSHSEKDPQGSKRADEYLNTGWAVTLDDLPLEKICGDAAERATRTLDVSKPKTGIYSVIVDSEVLAMLFNRQISQLSSSNSYHGLPFIAPGEELIPGAREDLITLTLDPSLDFGADTVALTESGLVQAPLTLVRENRVVATSTDKRYSDYLSLPATTVRGNVVVSAGSHTHEELTRGAPQVIEILQFSGLFADPNSGTFSSEIRLAKLYDNEKGTVSYVKGGSLSGSFRENLKGVRFSSQRSKRAYFTSNGQSGEGYFGPEFALLTDVSIVG